MLIIDALKSYLPEFFFMGAYKSIQCIQSVERRNVIKLTLLDTSFNKNNKITLKEQDIVN